MNPGFKMLNFLHHHKITPQKIKYILSCKSVYFYFSSFLKKLWVISFITVIIVLNYSGRKGMFKVSTTIVRVSRSLISQDMNRDITIITSVSCGTENNKRSHICTVWGGAGLFYSKFDHDCRHLIWPHLMQSCSSFFSLYMQKNWKTDLSKK